MPVIQINMIEGRTDEQKRELAKRVTDAVCETLNAPAERVRIIMNDMPKTNYAVAGELMADQESK